MVMGRVDAAMTTIDRGVTVQHDVILPGGGLDGVVRMGAVGVKIEDENSSGTQKGDHFFGRMLVKQMEMRIFQKGGSAGQADHVPIEAGKTMVF